MTLRHFVPLNKTIKILDEHKTNKPATEEQNTNIHLKNYIAQQKSEAELMSQTYKLNITRKKSIQSFLMQNVRLNNYIAFI